MKIWTIQQSKKQKEGKKTQKWAPLKENRISWQQYKINISISKNVKALITPVWHREHIFTFKRTNLKEWKYEDLNSTANLL